MGAGDERRPSGADPAQGALPRADPAAAPSPTTTTTRVVAAAATPTTSTCGWRRGPRPAQSAAGDGVAAGEGDVYVEELEMMKMMGIPVGFDSTKGKHVPDADVSGVRVVTKRQPWHYMNRRGGFNRPLPPERNR
ncbi:Os06g0515200 [Oryza sativa Japonica Group]|nr:Os06g0515200 [Oryza sativa Japonica Group]